MESVMNFSIFIVKFMICVRHDSPIRLLVNKYTLAICHRRMFSGYAMAKHL